MSKYTKALKHVEELTIACCLKDDESLHYYITCGDVDNLQELVNRAEPKNVVGISSDNPRSNRTRTGICPKCNQQLKTKLLSRTVHTYCENCGQHLVWTTERGSLLNLPIGTRIWVNNGCWYGRIVDVKSVKSLYVEYTGSVLELTPESDNDLDWTVVNNQDVDLELPEEVDDDTIPF